MSRLPRVSIIIPFWVDVPRFFSDLKKFKKLNYPNYEIIVVSDRKIKLDVPKARLVLTRKKATGPAEKRDLGIEKARGSICAFIDDDAYPDPDWLKNAVVHFKHPKVAAVGGPGLTPKEDGYWEQLTGLVYGSFFCGGHARHRFVKEKEKFVEDYPAYNLVVRKDVLKKIGGYGSYFYGGEDTFLCLKIIKENLLIVYDPDVVVYHHRRALFIPYLKQIANIGMHRGYFAKRFPETSRTFAYFVPSLLSLGFFALPVASMIFGFFGEYLFVLGLFIMLGYLSVRHKTDMLSALLVSFGIILTHVVYGVQFIRGLFVRKLKEE